MHPHFYRIALLLCLFALAISACALDKNGPVQAVENYLQAIVDQDSDRLVNRSCSEWEASAIIELDSLTATSAELDKVVCEEAGEQDDDSLVSCTGKILFNYNGEIQELDLAGRTYAVREEQGEWRVCGYR